MDAARHPDAPPGASLPRKGRPKPDSKTGRVWEIADTLFRERGEVPSRGEVIRRVVAAGGDEGTASTQFYLWRRSKAALDARDESPRRPSAPRGERLGLWLPVSEGGTLALPAEVIERMRLDGSREVLVEVVDGEVRLRSAPVALERVQRMVRSLDKGQGSIVDELIAERRAEAAREAEE